MISDLAAGLGYLHDHGLAHGALDPAAVVLLGDSGDGTTRPLAKLHTAVLAAQPAEVRSTGNDLPALGALLVVALTGSAHRSAELTGDWRQLADVLGDPDPTARPTLRAVAESAARLAERPALRDRTAWSGRRLGADLGRALRRNPRHALAPAG